MRIGIGHDFHRLVSGRKLVIGGVVIPYEKGLLGHSDADVLLHAICDALLGAAGLGDIGIHFPDNNPLLKDISSMIILEKCYKMICERGYSVVNADATIIAQDPKISPYRQNIQDNIGSILRIQSEDINIKATTTEQMGLIGQGEGIAATCVVLLNKINNMD